MVVRRAAMAVISPIMVATIVAAIVLAAKRSRYDRFGDDLKQRPARHQQHRVEGHRPTPPARDPQPGGVGR
ncbi:hypothetical protein MAHJHV35_46890 [Mycobacterium avium subsp. hominissuis]